MEDIKYIPEHERAKIPEDDFAGPGRTFPINSQWHVEAAAHLIGHASDPSKVKEKVIAIAKRKGYALPEAWHDEDGTKSFDMLVFQGGAVKSLGGGKIGGHLVLFSTKNDPDTSGDYFDSDTDFDFEDGDKRSGYYNHGFDVKIGNTKIGTGSLTKDKIGVWLEAQLKERDEYVDAIHQMVKDGALGLSSGALNHLVRREAKNKAGTLNYVSHWPIGEWSGTPTPAEPRTLAVSLKTWARGLSAAPITTENSSVVKADVSISTVRELEAALRDAGYSVKASKEITSRFTLRDVEPEPITQPEKAAPIDPAVQLARELKLARMLNRFEGMKLAAQ